MRRLIAFGLAVVVMAAVTSNVLAQDSGGTSQRATQMCVVIFGETPDAGWDVQSLLTAMTSGQAVIAEIDDGSKCAGISGAASTPAPAQPTPQLLHADAGQKSNAFAMAAGDYVANWEVIGDDCRVGLSLVSLDGTYQTQLAFTSTGNMATPAPVPPLIGVPAGTYVVDGSETTCTWVVAFTQYQ